MAKATSIASRYLPVVVWMVVIFIFSSRRSVTVADEYVFNFLFFKTLHIIEYSILFILLARATRNYKTAFIITILYAISDEIHQTFVPSREGRLRDVIIDAIGASITWLALRQLPKAPQKLRKWVEAWGIPSPHHD